jgi:hypothetical protein
MALRTISPVRLAAAALALTLPLWLVACSSDDDDTTSTATTAQPADTSSPPDDTASPDTTAPAETTMVEVWFTRDEQLAVGSFEATLSTPATDAMEALLAGPVDLDAEIGMTSAIPAGTELLGLDIADGTAIVDLSGTFESGGGSLSMSLRVAQVVSTLTQFDTVDRVTIRLDGRDVDAIGGEGVPAVDLTRDDVRRLTPFVVITSPLPGETVESEVTIEGISNTFEANVLWSLVDGDGLELDSGFTTATAGNGTWGTFSVSVPIPSNATAGLGAVVAWQENAAGPEEGGELRRDVYEVPIAFGG